MATPTRKRKYEEVRWSLSRSSLAVRYAGVSAFRFPIVGVLSLVAISTMHCTVHMSDMSVASLVPTPLSGCGHETRVWHGGLAVVSFPDRIFRARRKNGSGQLPIPFSFKCAGMLAHCSFLI